MYTPANGYTKETIIEKIRTEFNGKAVCPIRNACDYRTSGDRKCAIGIFIPNEFTDIYHLTGSVKTISKRHPRVMQYLPLADLGGLSKFQSTHDELSFELTVEQQTQELIDWVERNVE